MIAVETTADEAHVRILRAEVLGNVIPNTQKNAGGTLTDLAVAVNATPVVPDSQGNFYRAIPAPNATAPQWEADSVLMVLIDELPTLATIQRMADRSRKVDAR